MPRNRKSRIPSTTRTASIGVISRREERRGWPGSEPVQSTRHHPYAIATDADGYIYVADTDNHRIQVFNADGTFDSKWGGWGSGDGQLYNPQGIAVAPDGTVYVADTLNNRIQQFRDDDETINRNWVLVRKWGISGSGDGQFSSPIGITVAPDGSVYVADSYNDRIQVYSGDTAVSAMPWIPLLLLDNQ
ncbi:MAG: 6-bladed beta-propeller [Syntrophobacteraceae bacterium]